MSEVAAPQVDWHESVLRELTELGLVASRDLQVRLVAAGAGEEAAVLAHALDRVTRSVRLSVGLSQKIARWRALDARAAAREDREAAEDRRKARAKAARQALERRITVEVEDDEESERLVDEAGERVDFAALTPGFDAARIEDIVETIAADLGLEPLADADEAESPEGAEASARPLPFPPPAVRAAAAEELEGDFSDGCIVAFPPNSS